MDGVAAKEMELEQLRLEVARLKGEPLRLDLGCGKVKKEGFKGADIRKFDGVDFIVNLGADKWPWPNDSVDEVHCSHMVEHLTWPQRVHFFNELHRVLKRGAKAVVVMPHWCSSRWHGDPDHKEPMSEWAWLYMRKEWRETQAPHDDDGGPRAYTCDFDVTHYYNIHPALAGRSQEFINFALTFYKEAATDMVATLIAKK